MRHLGGHTGAVRAVGYSPDGRLVSAGQDRTVRIWDLAKGETVQSLRSSGPVYAVAISPDGQTLAYAGRYPSASNDGTPIKVWNLTTGQAGADCLLPPTDRPRSIWSLSYSHDGKYLAAATRRVGGGNFTHGAGGHIWGPSTHEPIDEETAYAVRFAPDRLVLAVNSERRVQFLDVLNEAAVSYPLPVSRPESVVFLPGSANSVVVAGKYLFVLNTAHSNRRRRIKTGFRAVKGVAASSDGQFLVAVGTPGEVEVINVANGQCAVRYDVEFGGVNAVSVAPDGLTFAVGTEKGLVLFDVDSW